MANEADMAADISELFLNVSLANSKNRGVDSPAATGACLFCEEPLDKPKRWCDSYCRDDWQRLTNSKRHASGKPPISADMLGE